MNAAVDVSNADKVSSLLLEFSFLLVRSVRSPSLLFYSVLLSSMYVGTYGVEIRSRRAMVVPSDRHGSLVSYRSDDSVGNISMIHVTDGMLKSAYSVLHPQRQASF